MIIKTVGQLRKELDGLGDDFEIKMLLQVEDGKGHFPQFSHHELLLEDVGYSDKVVLVGIGEEL